MTDKPKRDTNAGRARRTHRYWKEAIESGQLTGQDLAYAIRQIERHEKAKSDKKAVQQTETTGYINHTNFAAIQWAKDCINRGLFQGTLSEFFAAMRKDVEQGGNLLFLDSLTDEEMQIPSDDLYWTSDENPRPHGEPLKPRSEQERLESRRRLETLLAGRK